MSFTLRAPCSECQYLEGEIREKGGQDCVFCGMCGRFQYNAPRVETGKPQRSVRSRPEISPGLRALVLEESGNRCEHCGRSPAEHGVVLHIAHWLSVADAKELGVDDITTYGADNLHAACEECNLGQGDRSYSPKIIALVLRARAADRRRRGGK